MMKIIAVLLTLAALGGCSTVPPPCPGETTIIMRAYDYKRLPANLRAEADALIAKAAARDSRNATDPSAYRGESVSNTLGPKLRAFGTLANVTGEIQLVARKPDTAEVLADLGTIQLRNGEGTKKISPEQRAQLVETIWRPRDRFISPTESGGERRLWLFPDSAAGYCTVYLNALAR